MEIPFVGGAYEGYSKNVNAQRCVNLFPAVDRQNPKNTIALYGTPGLTEFYDGLSVSPATLYDVEYLDGNLSIHYKLDETSGVTAEDSAGSSNGTFTNGPGDDSQWTTGKTNNGLLFDGTNDYLSLTTPETLMQSSLSLCYWINAVALASSKYMFGIYDWQAGPIVNSFYGIVTAANELQITYTANSNSAVVITDQSIVSDFTSGFHHIAITLDGTTMKVYMDSTLVSSFSGASNGSMTSVTMGDFAIGGGVTYFPFGCTNWNGANTGYINAVFDGIRFYDTALSSSNVSSIYTSGL